jgi:dUTP pyrophosphatase
MTYREYVLRKYPEAFDPRHKDLMKGCPSDYGLEVKCNDMIGCKECWNTVITEQETGQKLKVMLDPGAIMPTRAHSTDAGLDLYSPVRQVLRANDRASIDTGVRVAIPAGYVGMITSKSGLMAKEGITCRGTIDAGYTGSIKAVLFNHSQKDYIVEKGQKITQLVIFPIITPEPELVDSLEETERGEGGFGSTGKF